MRECLNEEKKRRKGGVGLKKRGSNRLREDKGMLELF